MPLSDLLKTEITPLIVTTAPVTVSVVDPAVCEMAIDFATIDTLGSSIFEIRVNVPSLAGAGSDELQQWADQLCQRVTYLLENIGTLEVDPASQQVLIRSTPPDQQSHGTLFYEIILANQSGGRFTLRRYESIAGTAGRTPVDMTLTHEVLYKLADDLAATIP